MPYIITTTEPPVGTEVPCGRVVIRTAVATLEEARKATFHTVTDTPGYATCIGFPTDTAIAESILESGGTVGPLPDGTVIEVRPISFGALASRAGFAQFSDERSHAEIITAFNGAQA